MGDLSLKIIRNRFLDSSQARIKENRNFFVFLTGRESNSWDSGTMITYT